VGIEASFFASLVTGSAQLAVLPVAMILRGAFRLIAVGLVLGLPLTFAAVRFLGNQLYGMNPYDPFVALTAVAVLALPALMASLIPALRASRISPAEALRSE
jgi:ABC-type antimicrobial peptide transport system permease subunit